MSQHNGWIDVRSELGCGSTFAIYLPALPVERETEAEETPTPDAPRGRGERILVVEDEDQVRRFAIRLLSDEGYVVSGAANAREAVEIFEREKGQFDLVFSDVVLPDSSGIHLLDEFRRRKPGCRALLASGYAEDQVRRPHVGERGCLFIPKPYTIDELLRAVRDVIGQGE